MTALSGLRGLFGTTDLADFFAHAWEREVRLFPGPLVDAVDGILTREQFEFSLAAPPAGPGGGLSIVDGQLARPVVVRDGSAAHVEAVYAAYAAGSTILQTRLQFRNEALADLCADIEHDFRAQGIPLVEAVSANAYLTPRRGQGFGVHYDNHCAVVLQVSGHKAWTVFPPVEESPLEPCTTTLNPADLGARVLDATLAPGDVLYVPRGFPHMATCGDTESLHVTISLRPMSWAEAIGALCREDPRFRRSVAPTAFDGAAAASAHVGDVLVPALTQLPVRQFLQGRAFGDGAPTAPTRRGRLAAIDASHDIGEHTPVERVADVDCRAVEHGDAAFLRFAGTSIRLDGAMGPVFHFIAGTHRFTPSDLPDIGQPYDRLELATILVERGLLRVASAPAVPATRAPEPAAPAPVVADPGDEGADEDGPAPSTPARRGLRDFSILRRGSLPSDLGIEWVQCAERLSADDCDEIIAACQEFPELSPHTVGEDRYPGHRRALMRKVGLTPRTRWIFDLLCDVSGEATRTYFGLELTGITRAPQYVEYSPGRGQFDRHNDYSHDQATTPRKLTVILQLSDPRDYAGGRLRAFGITAEELPDERGTVVALPSFVYHDVTPVERGMRRALVAWVAGPRLR